MNWVKLRFLQKGGKCEVEFLQKGCDYFTKKLRQIQMFPT